MIFIFMVLGFGALVVLDKKSSSGSLNRRIFKGRRRENHVHMLLVVGKTEVAGTESRRDPSLAIATVGHNRTLVSRPIEGHDVEIPRNRSRARRTCSRDGKQGNDQPHENPGGFGCRNRGVFDFSVGCVFHVKSWECVVFVWLLCGFLQIAIIFGNFVKRLKIAFKTHLILKLSSEHRIIFSFVKKFKRKSCKNKLS